MPVQFVRHFASLADATAATRAYVETYLRGGNAARIAARSTPKLNFATPDGRPVNGKAIVVFDMDDTLVRKSGGRIAEVVALAKELAEMGARIHIITARLNDDDAREETLAQLAKLGITYASVSLAPEDRRDDLAAVSVWKREIRAYIAQLEGAPVILTVGDMASDLTEFAAEEMLDEFDAAQAADASARGVEPSSDGVGTRGRSLGGSSKGPPVSIVRTEDGTSLYGLKLREAS